MADDLKNNLMSELEDNTAEDNTTVAGSTFEECDASAEDGVDSDDLDAPADTGFADGLDLNEVEVDDEDSGICAEGYSIVEITTKKLTRHNFRARFAFHADFQMLQDLLANGGRAFGLRKSGLIKEGPIEAVFTIRITENGYHCEKLLYADSVSEPERQNMRKYVRLEVGRLALMANCHDNSFLGEKLPELVRKVGSPNWLIGLCFVFLYAVALKALFLDFVTAVCVSFALGISMSFCFRSVKYHFESRKE